MFSILNTIVYSTTLCSVTNMLIFNLVFHTFFCILILSSDRRVVDFSNVVCSHLLQFWRGRLPQISTYLHSSKSATIPCQCVYIIWNTTFTVAHTLLSEGDAVHAILNRKLYMYFSVWSWYITCSSGEYRLQVNMCTCKYKLSSPKILFSCWFYIFFFLLVLLQPSSSNSLMYHFQIICLFENPFFLPAHVLFIKSVSCINTLWLYFYLAERWTSNYN